MYYCSDYLCNCKKTCGECLATFQDVINFKNRTIVKDGSIENLKLYENTGYKEVDESLQYASDYIEATDGMSIINVIIQHQVP